MAQIKKDTSLRKAILQAAITGQLISSCHSELDSESAETGKELLDRIIEERNKKLLAEWTEAKKTNPKAKKPAPIVASLYDKEGRLLSEVEAPFEIPENWCWCRLGDVGDWGAGATPNRSKKEYYSNEGIPWIKTGELNNGIVTSAEEFITEKALKECSLRFNRIGDVMIAMYGATIGKVAIAGIELTTNQACCACTPFTGLYNKFLFYFLMANKDNFVKQGEGGAQPNISREKIVKTLFPLPPLAVQNAIVAKLEQVLPLVDAYENALLQKEELKSTLPDKVKKAILQEAITGKLTEAWRKSAVIKESGKQLLARIIEERNAKALADWKEALKKNPKAKKPVPVVASEIEEEEIPFEVPESWCWCRLGDICTKLVDGDHNPPAGLPVKTEYIMASSQNINDDSLVELEKVRYLSKEVFEVENERTKAEKGDIFFTSVGTLGRSCVYDGSKNICFQRSVSVIKTEIFNKFLKYCLDAPYIQFFILDNATGTAQKGFYLNQLAKLIIPLPPLEEQEEIVKKVEELLSVCK